MNLEKLRAEYLPMTETAYFILLSLIEPRHGYGSMQYVEEISGRRVRIGAGTMYGTLSKLVRDGLICPVAEEDRRKIYGLTDLGLSVLDLELARLEELVRLGAHARQEVR